MTWVSGQAGLSIRFGSSVAIGHAVVVGWGELSLRDQSLQHRQCQHSPRLSALAPCISLVSSLSGTFWGRWTPVPGIHRWVKSPCLKVCAGVYTPGELLSFLLGLGDLRPYRVWEGLSTRWHSFQRASSLCRAGSSQGRTESLCWARGIAAARNDVPYPHVLRGADTHMAALPAPLISLISPGPSFFSGVQGSHTELWARLHPAACLLAGQKRWCPHVSLGKLRCACRIRFSAM